MDDLDEILEALTTAWTAMAGKVTTIWLPIQLVIIALILGITFYLQSRKRDFI